MLTVEEALDHLGYDETDDKITRTVTAELEEAKAYMLGAVGADLLELLPDDPRVNILLKAYLDDRHDDRGTTSAKAGNAKRELIHSTEWQLKMELARKREEVGA
jgi:hypothetical protein